MRFIFCREMVQLFSKGRIKQEVQEIAGLDIADKITIVQKLYAEYKNGNADDETRYEQNFNQLFFNELLGYNRNDHMHPKAGTPVGGKIADLGLGLFREGKYNFDDVQVVVELKGAKIFLDKKQNRQNPQSPVDQGFGYKTSFKNCRWLIVSNFHQIRLYRDNKQDYEERNIADLAKGDDNFFQLRKLLILMGAKYLLSTDGESRTEKLMSQFRIDQQKITKKFYQEYKGLRLDLINDIRYKNPQLDIEIILEKAQKIIDRIVFVHFCEDKGLLPADKLKEVIDYGEKALSPVRQTLKNFFEAVNSGSPKLEIPNGYNGGLFHTDEVLNNLVVGDAICKKFVAVGDYDFDDELSVNILGHIFEQSISDLEQLKIDLLGTEVETDQLVEKKKQSKRKKDGIFYTPEYIVDYIVQNSLMKYLSEKEDECLAKYKDEQKAYQAYQHILQNVKVLDPACGSGAFLVKVFDVLYMENQRVGTLIGGLFDESETYKNILTNNIFGVDLNPESVEITKLSLWLKSAQKGKKLNNLDKNIKCGNSLIDDPAVAGERAFDWNKEFKNIMDAGGFDVIVGNPPYGATIDSDVEYLGNKYPNSTKAVKDTYKIFIDLSLSLIKHGSYMGFVIPNTFIYQPRYQDIRDLYSSFVIYILNLGEKIFEDVELPTAILVIHKVSPSTQFIHSVVDVDRSDLPIHLSSFDVLTTRSDGKIILPKKVSDIVLLEDILDMKDGGVKHQANGIGKGEKGKSDLRDRIYYTSDVNYKSDYPLFIGADIGRYAIISTPTFYLKHNYKELLNSNETVYFNKMMMTANTKIVWRQTADRVMATIIYDQRFANTLQSGIVKDKYIGKVDFKFILLVINSTYYQYLYRQKVLEAGKVFPQVKLQYLKPLPFKIIPLNEQEPFIDKADQMLSLNKELYDKKSSAIKLLQAEYGIEKISRKLESFWELDFADFVKALGVKSLSLDKKEELMGWFGKKKEELVSLRAMIDQTDREIDGMVYTLYGLSDEEIAVVEGK